MSGFLIVGMVKVLDEKCLRWYIQKEYHKKVVSGKEPDTLIIVEHEPVYTLGKSANDNHLL